MNDITDPLLCVRGLTVDYRTPARGLWRRDVVRRAVKNVAFEVGTGQTLGLVGESGSGKTTIGRALVGLVKPTSGTIRYRGRDLRAAGRRERRSLRREIQIVLQDPMGSLNPRMPILRIVREPLDIHHVGSRDDRHHMVVDTLHRVGLESDCLPRYPHEFSGGQRQRINIARAVILKPRLLILDEPTSALDVTIQAQILRMLEDLRRDLQLSCLFITHNLAVVQMICDHVAVLYGGQLIEQGRVAEVFREPQHDYTRALLSAVPSLDSYRYRATRRA